MASYAPCMPGPRRGGFPAPPFRPDDHWAAKKWVALYVGDVMKSVNERLTSVETSVGSLDSRLRALETAPAPLAGRRFPLLTNDDLYVALAAVVTALGGEVTE